MLGVFGSRCVLTGSTSWMNWLRRPRLNNAVHSVAVLTAFSFSRVAGFSEGMQGLREARARCEGRSSRARLRAMRSKVAGPGFEGVHGGGVSATPCSPAGAMPRAAASPGTRTGCSARIGRLARLRSDRKSICATNASRPAKSSGSITCRNTLPPQPLGRVLAAVARQALRQRLDHQRQPEALVAVFLPPISCSEPRGSACSSTRGSRVGSPCASSSHGCSNCSPAATFWRVIDVVVIDAQMSTSTGCRFARVADRERIGREQRLGAAVGRDALGRRIGVGDQRDVALVGGLLHQCRQAADVMAAADRDRRDAVLAARGIASRSRGSRATARAGSRPPTPR